MNQVADQIKEMLTLGEIEETTDDKGEEVSGAKTPNAETPKDANSELTNKSEDTDEVDDEDSEEIDETEEEPDEEDSDVESQLESLRRENAKLKKALNKNSDESVGTIEETKEAAIAEFNFVTDEDVDALGDTKSLNTLMNKVYKQAVEYATENVLRRVPQLVQKQVSTETANQEMVSTFFRQNNDLLPVRRYVASEFQQVLSENPDMSYPEALAATAKIVRSSLGLAKQNSRPVKKKKPSMPDGSRGRSTPRKPGGIAEEIAAMARA